MNDNVGDMPIEIFGDYVSDCLDIEFPWEYLSFTCNGFSYSESFNYKFGYGKSYYHISESIDGNGNGYDYGYAMNRFDAWGTGVYHLRHLEGKIPSSGYGGRRENK